MDDGWDESAHAWIAYQGDEGDFTRRHVMDAPMLARVRAGGFTRALDVGCGEGRFCRMLRQEGVAAIGVDPTEKLIERARECDPGGDYRIARAEALEFPDASFDLVVAYLALIDIPDYRRAIAEMARVLAPGGALLVANLAGFVTAAVGGGWQETLTGARYSIDRYLEERSEWVAFRGMRICNWHRPQSAYFQALLGAGLTLAHFDEPAPTGGPDKRASRYRRVPYALLMEWRKPG